MDPLTMMKIAKTAGTVFGAIQSAQGAVKGKQADRMAPDVIDPNRVRDMEEAKRRQASLASGTDTTTQQTLKEGKQNTRATQRDIARSTGGNVPGTVSGLLQSQRLGGNIQNQAFANAGEKSIAMGNLYNKIAEDISQRKLDIEQYRSVQKRAEAARLKKEGMANLSAGLTSLLGNGMGDTLGLNAPSTDSSQSSFGTTPTTAPTIADGDLSKLNVGNPVSNALSSIGK